MDPSISNRHIQTALGWCDDLFEREIMWPEVRAALMPAFSQASDTRDALVTNELAGARFTLNVIANAAEKPVKAGEFHIYRGKLSDRGQSLVRIAKLALEQVYENEWFSYESYEERLRELDEAVATSG